MDHKRTLKYLSNIKATTYAVRLSWTRVWVDNSIPTGIYWIISRHQLLDVKTFLFNFWIFEIRTALAIWTMQHLGVILNEFGKMSLSVSNRERERERYLKEAGTGKKVVHLTLGFPLLPFLLSFLWCFSFVVLTSTNFLITSISIFCVENYDH